ncbi:hypothetical protein [Enterococcus sp. AZ135]
MAKAQRKCWEFARFSYLIEKGGEYDMPFIFGTIIGSFLSVVCTRIP